MKDIVLIEDGQDLRIEDSAVPKAANIISVQLGSLEYAQDLGVDLKYFLQSGVQFQNESFKAYLIQRLTDQQVDVSQAIDVINKLYQKITFYVGDVPTPGGLIS